MSRENYQDQVFKALADTRRRELLDLIKDEPKTTSDLCAHFESLDRCTVMQHLGVLEKAGLIIVQKKGRYRWNYINVVPIHDIYSRWISRFATPNVELLSKLKQDMENSSTVN